MILSSLQDNSLVYPLPTAERWRSSAPCRELEDTLFPTKNQEKIFLRLVQAVISRSDTRSPGRTFQKRKFRPCRSHRRPIHVEARCSGSRRSRTSKWVGRGKNVTRSKNRRSRMPWPERIGFRRRPRDSWGSARWFSMTRSRSIGSPIRPGFATKPLDLGASLENGSAEKPPRRTRCGPLTPVPTPSRPRSTDLHHESVGQDTRSLSELSNIGACSGVARCKAEGGLAPL